MQSLYLAVVINDKHIQDELAVYQTLLKQQIKGDWVDPTTFHITMDFLSDNEKEFDIVVQALKMFEKNNYEFKNQYVFASGINRFDMNATWIGLNDSLKLYKIKYLINDYLKQLGFDKKKSKFKEYVPHITLGFNCENKPINIKVNKIAIPVDNITLWNSFKCNGKYVSNYLYAVNL